MDDPAWEAWRPAAVAGAADGLVASCRRLAEAADAFARGAPPAGWQGGAARAAAQAHRLLCKAIADLLEAGRVVAGALDATAEQLRVAHALAGLDDERAAALALRADADLAAVLAHVAARQDPHDAHAARLPRLAHRFAAAGELAKVSDLGALRATLAADPSLRLLHLDPDGDDRLLAAVATGRVGTADHVAVVVPGFGTSLTASLADGLAGVRRLLARAAEVDRLAGDPTPDGYAGVWYLGYEPPQPDLTLLGPDSVVTPRRAQEGAAGLAAFLAQVSARGDAVHVTVLGHSYGSLVAGLALRRPTGVDDAVVLGSPGVGTGDAAALDVPAGHVHHLEADLDPVGDLGWFGRDPSSMPGVVQLSTDAAVRHGEKLAGVRGHTAYDAPGSTSEWNQAAVVAGRYEETVPDDGPSVADRLRDLLHERLGW